MTSIKKMVVVVAMAAGALWLAPVSMVLSACGPSGAGGQGGGTGGGAGGGSGGGGTGAECFSGTPTTNDQLLNACTDQTVEKILKQTTWRDPGTTLPMLP